MCLQNKEELETFKSAVPVFGVRNDCSLQSMSQSGVVHAEQSKGSEIVSS